MAGTELPSPGNAVAMADAPLYTHPQKQQGRAEPRGSEEEGWGGLAEPASMGLGFNCWFTACRQKYMAVQ